jgi:hypothetical protein
MLKPECESGLFKTYNLDVSCHKSKVLPVSKSAKLLLTLGAYTLAVTRVVSNSCALFWCFLKLRMIDSCKLDRRQV